MPRMLIHAGFHKTGTTSVQNTLAHNKALLAPVLRIFLRKQIPSICENARAYSASRDKIDLISFSYEVAQFLEALDPDDPRDILISAEDLCGLMPGRRNLTRYDAAPLLLKAFVLTAEKILPDSVDLAFYFSMRAPDTWLPSCYAQHLRVIRMVLSEAEYCDTFAESANLRKVVDSVRFAVSPIPVLATPIEQTNNKPYGVLSPIFDHLNLPQNIVKDLKVLPPANVSLPTELRQEFLRLNRDVTNRGALKKAKNRARRHYWLQQTEQAS